MSEGAAKHDGEKVRLELVPFDLLWEVGRVMTMGAKKYAAFNWAKGMDWSRPYGAALRHMTAWFDGEDKDPESGFSHLAHAGCEIAFLLAYQARGLGKDDRHRYDEVK